MVTNVEWAILIGSWCVPVITLLISWWITRKYLKELHEEAKRIEEDTKAKVMEVEKLILERTKQVDISAIVKTELEKQLPEIRSSVTKAIDGKLGNIIRQLREAAREEVEEKVEKIKEEYQNESPNLGTGLFNIIKGAIIK